MGVELSKLLPSCWGIHLLFHSHPLRQYFFPPGTTVCCVFKDVCRASPFQRVKSEMYFVKWLLEKSLFLSQKKSQNDAFSKACKLLFFPLAVLYWERIVLTSSVSKLEKNEESALFLSQKLSTLRVYLWLLTWEVFPSFYCLLLMGCTRRRCKEETSLWNLTFSRYDSDSNWMWIWGPTSWRYLWSLGGLTLPPQKIPDPVIRRQNSFRREIYTVFPQYVS